MADAETAAGTQGPEGAQAEGPALDADVVASGSGFRAVLKRAGDVVWWCPHVHFTDHSARNCPAAREELARQTAA